MSEITLNLVDIRQNEKGYYEYDFCPDRKFDGVEYCILWSKECWGNLDYIQKFIECDQKNIQLICYTSYNFFPVCSYICHKCIMSKCEMSFFQLRTRISCTGLSNVDQFVKDYNITTTIFNLLDRSLRRSMSYNTNLWHVHNLYRSKFSRKEVYIDKKAYEKFQTCDMFTEKSVVALYKDRRYGYIIKKLADDGVEFINKDLLFINEVIDKHSGHDYVCSFQILSSLLKGVGYFGYGGSASFSCLTLPINTLFVCDNIPACQESMIYLKNLYNKDLYGVNTTGIYHVYGNETDYPLDSGWRYDCLKDCIKLNQKCVIPKLIINDIKPKIDRKTELINKLNILRNKHRETNNVNKKKEIDLHDVCYIIGHRDVHPGKTRTRNLLYVLDWLKRDFPEFEVIVIEQSEKETLTELIKDKHPNLKYKWVYNPGFFNKCWGFNIATKMTNKPYLVFGDGDVFMNKYDLTTSINALSEFDAVNPKDKLYKVEYENLPQTNHQTFINGSGLFCAGIFCISKSALFDVFQFDEDFRGWGDEDQAQSYKIKTLILNVSYNFPAYHITHEKSLAAGDIKRNSLHENNSYIWNKIIKGKDKIQLREYYKDKIENYGKENKYDIVNNTGSIDLHDICYIIGHRDVHPGKTRTRNLLYVLDWLKRDFPEFEVIVIEQSEKETLTELIKDKHPNLKYKWVYNPGFFNRSRTFNIGEYMTNKKYIVCADNDIIMNKNDFVCSVNDIQFYDAISPFSVMVDLTEEDTVNFNINNIQISKKRKGINFCSGICVFTKDSFKKIFGWDEEFNGWGEEDRAQTHKVETLLTHKTIPNTCYHLYHERSKDAGDVTNHVLWKKNIELYNKIKKMNSDEIKQYYKNYIIDNIEPNRPLEYYINIIRNIPLSYLLDKNKLADIIQKCGLRNMKYYKTLHKYQNYGIQPIQTPGQLAEYLIYIHDKNIKDYLEIGVDNCGLLIWTVEYLNRFTNVHTATAIDIEDKNQIIREYKKYSKTNIVFLKFDTMSLEFKNWIADKTFDLIFIDGNHSYNNIINDMVACHTKCSMLGLHDIVDCECCGVVAAYELYKKKYTNYTYNEFISQISNATEFSKYRHGIGLILKKKINSWDLFDTLIGRKCFKPSGIFERLEKITKIKNLSNIRQLAEKTSIKKTFDDIYLLIQKTIMCDDATLLSIKKLEWDIELENLFPIQENINRIANNDIIVSDTYFSKEQIKKIISLFNINCSNIFISYDGKSKNTIWKTVLNNYDVLCHTGDNIISDVKNPRLFNIATVHFESNKTDLESKITCACYDLSNLMRYTRLSNGENEYKNMWFMLSQYYIPLLSSIKHHLLSTIKAKKYRKIWLTSRDCGILFNILKKDGLSNIDLLYTSRKNYKDNSSDNTFHKWYNKNIDQNDLIYDISSTKDSLNFFIERTSCILPDYVSYNDCGNHKKIENSFIRVKGVETGILELMGHYKDKQTIKYINESPVFIENSIKENNSYAIKEKFFNLIDWKIPENLLDKSYIDEILLNIRNKKNEFLYYYDDNVLK